MDFYNKPTPFQCLMHYGVKGMKWGVRRYESKSGHLTTSGKARYNLLSDRKFVLEKPKLSKIGLQFFAKKPSDFKTIRLPKKEYAHVMSEIATHVISEERAKDIVMKYIGQYRYMAENLHDGTFRIIGKSRIP